MTVRRTHSPQRLFYCRERAYQAPLREVYPPSCLTSRDCSFKLIEWHVRCVGAVWTNPPSAVVPEWLPDDVFAPAVLKADVYVWRPYPPPPTTHISNSVDLA
jgi:hypothetical protein